jgi:hypothetical protein
MMKVLSMPDSSENVTNEDDDDDEEEDMKRLYSLDRFSSGKEKLRYKKRKIFPFQPIYTALSSIGPFLDRLDDMSPPLRIVWRQQGFGAHVVIFIYKTTLLGPWMDQCAKFVFVTNGSQNNRQGNE